MKRSKARRHNPQQYSNPSTPTIGLVLLGVAAVGGVIWWYTNRNRQQLPSGNRQSSATSDNIVSSTSSDFKVSFDDEPAPRATASTPAATTNTSGGSTENQMRR